MTDRDRPARSASEVLRLIGSPHLKLYRCTGHGYWYFVYACDHEGVYDSKSVYVMRLNDMPLRRWVDEGLAFVRTKN